MSSVRITIGQQIISARWESERAPRTCAALQRQWPLTGQLLHARWSGEACWVPLGDLDIGVDQENVTARPEPGQILFYPGGISETEILIAYGSVRFSSKAGPLAGNHALTVIDGLDRLASLGVQILMGGSQNITFE